MHISRIALIPALLAITANTFPLRPGNVSVIFSGNEGTKPFSEHYTSIVGNGENTGIAHATPAPTALDAKATSITGPLFIASTNSSPTATLLTPAFANITTPTPDNTILDSDDLLSDPLILEAIRSDLETYNIDYEPPKEEQRVSLPEREQIMLKNLFRLINLLPCEERAAAEAIAELVLQKALHANATSEAEDLNKEEIEQVEKIVESITSELFRLVDSSDSDYDFTFQVCNSDEPLPNDLRALVPRSPNSKSKSPATCPNGSEIPVSGIQDCPPPKEWQLAQKQDRELRKHLKKEKSDRTRDHMRIASTTFASVACVVSPITCPLLAAKGII